MFIIQAVWKMEILFKISGIFVYRDRRDSDASQRR